MLISPLRWKAFLILRTQGPARRNAKCVPVFNSAFSEIFTVFTNKKENQIFLIYKEIQNRAVA
jgi:hypothetical protein